LDEATDPWGVKVERVEMYAILLDEILPRTPFHYHTAYLGPKDPVWQKIGAGEYFEKKTFRVLLHNSS